jgi:hypothetical protein
VTALPVLGEVLSEFAKTVEAALREKGNDTLAEQVSNLRIVSLCPCTPHCGAFLSVPLHDRGDGALRTEFLLHNAEMTVLVDSVEGLIVGLDVLDSGQLRKAIDRFVKPS